MVFSKVVLAGIVCSLLLQVIGIMWNKSFYVKGKGCIRNASAETILTAGVFGPPVFHLAHLVLHLLPLSKHYRHLTGIETVYTRCTRSAVICIIFSLIVTTTFPFFKRWTLKFDWLTKPMIASFVVMCTSINLLAMIFSYSDYRARLCLLETISSLRRSKIKPSHVEDLSTKIYGTEDQTQVSNVSAKVQFQETSQ